MIDFISNLATVSISLGREWNNNCDSLAAERAQKVALEGASLRANPPASLR